MKSKLLLFIEVIILCVVLVTFTGCSNGKIENNVVESDNVEKQVEQLKKDIPSGEFSDMGKGTFKIRTVSGTSENGNIPVIFVDKDYMAGQKYEMEINVGISTRNFDATRLTTIYVDGVSHKKDQLGDTDTSVNVSSKLSTVGIHKIELLQFDDDNEVITYKSAEYEVKSK